MDIKITKSRLKNFLSYEWFKILLSIVAVLVVWSLLFTTTATRLTTGQQFYFTIFDGVNSISNNSESKILQGLREDALSFDVYTCGLQDLRNSGGYGSGYMLNLRMSVKDCDVMLMDGEINGEHEEGFVSQFDSYCQMRYFVSIEDYIEEAKSYCSNLIDESGKAKEKEVEDFFVKKRIKKADSYLRLYRDINKLNEDIPKEVKRIQDIYDNALYLENAINKAKTEGNDFLYYFGEDENEKAYAINLGKMNLNSENNIGEYWNVSDGANGYTTNGLLLSVFDFRSSQYDLHFEGLAVLKYFVENFSVYGGAKE